MSTSAGRATPPVAVSARVTPSTIARLASVHSFTKPDQSSVADGRSRSAGFQSFTTRNSNEPPRSGAQRGNSPEQPVHKPR